MIAYNLLALVGLAGPQSLSEGAGSVYSRRFVQDLTFAIGSEAAASGIVAFVVHVRGILVRYFPCIVPDRLDAAVQFFGDVLRLPSGMVQFGDQGFVKWMASHVMSAPQLGQNLY